MLMSILLSLLLATNQCQAAPKTCDALLNECMIVVHEADASISLYGKHIELLQDENKNLQTALDLEIERATHAEAWYRDPKLIAPTVFILGFITAIHAERH